MIARVARLTIWFALGATLLAATFWLFLNTPESNTLALTASAALLLAMIVLAAVIVNGAVLLTQGRGVGRAVIGGVRGMHWFLLAAVPLAVAWWLLTVGDSWVSEHSGEINAWFIAQFGWADISWLFRAQTWLTRWIGWVLVPLAALSLVAALLQHGVRGVGRERWLSRAWHWRTLVAATITFVVLFVLPWRLSAWRPELPPTWMQLASGIGRLGLLALLWAIGAATLVALATRDGQQKASLEDPLQGMTG